MKTFCVLLACFFAAVSGQVTTTTTNPTTTEINLTTRTTTTITGPTTTASPTTTAGPRTTERTTTETCPIQTEKWTQFLQNETERLKKEVVDLKSDLRTLILATSTSTIDNQTRTQAKLQEMLNGFKTTILNEVNWVLANPDHLRNANEALNLTEEEQHALKVKELDLCCNWRRKVASLKFTSLDSGTYYFYPGATSWQGANAVCEANDMKLAVIKSETEMKLLATAAPQQRAYWVGAADVRHIPGHFLWSDTQAVNKNWWIKGKPNASTATTQACVYLDPANKGLGDVACGYASTSICKVTGQFANCI